DPLGGGVPDHDPLLARAEGRRDQRADVSRRRRRMSDLRTGSEPATTDPEGLHHRLSPLAYPILQHHRARPDFAMDDLAVFGTRAPSPQQLEELAAAYRELEEAGLVERTDSVQRYRGRFYYLYKPT